MPTIQPCDSNACSPEAKTMLNGINKKMGRTPNIFQTMACTPQGWLLEAYLGFSGAAAKSSIPAAQREQLAIACAGATGCDYCASAHTFIGKGAGVTDQQAGDALYAKSNDPKLQAALQFCCWMIANPCAGGPAYQSQVQTLRGAGWTDPQILEICGIACLNFYTNFFNHVAGTECDFQPMISAQGACCSKAA